MRIRPESFLFIIFLSALGGLTPLSIDMGLPALHSIGTSLSVPPASVAMTLSLFLIGFAFGPTALGPISDCYGRRPVLLISTTLFVVAGLGCSTAGSLPWLLFWRLFQGIGAGGSSTLALAIVRDSYSGAEARQRLSYVATMGAFAPMIAPNLGAIVLGWFGWRAIYGSLAGAGLILLTTVWIGFRESNQRLDPTALQPRQLLRNYGRLFTNRTCLGYSLVLSLNFGSMFSYITSSPLVMMGVLHVSPSNYGWTFAATALGIMTGAFCNGRLTAWGYSRTQLLGFGLTLSNGSAGAIVALCLLNKVAVCTILPLLVLHTFCMGFIGPNATQAVLAPIPDIAGLASAVLGSMRMFVGAFAGFLVSMLFDNRTAFAMGECMSAFSLLSLAAFLYANSVPSPERLELVDPQKLPDAAA